MKVGREWGGVERWREERDNGLRCRKGIRWVYIERVWVVEVFFLPPHSVDMNVCAADLHSCGRHSSCVSTGEF